MSNFHHQVCRHENERAFKAKLVVFQKKVLNCMSEIASIMIFFIIDAETTYTNVAKHEESN